VGMDVVMATPKGHEPDADYIELAKNAAKQSQGSILITDKVQDAIKGADVVYTDSWVSMGQESEEQKRKAIFADFQVNQKLIKASGADPYIMHCLPAHRGMEITDEVIESKKSIVFDQAENRLHAQKAIMLTLMK
jgi:ornithine carbamoyltransferase